jgi:ornithine cyclodeaminase/alanine dehydrogenase
MQQDRREISSRINIGKEVWYLTQEEVVAAGVTEQDILQLTLDALVAHGRKEYEMPAKIGVHPHQEVFFHAMPAYVPGRLALGMKWIECYPNNPGKLHDHDKLSQRFEREPAQRRHRRSISPRRRTAATARNI